MFVFHSFIDYFKTTKNRPCGIAAGKSKTVVSLSKNTTNPYCFQKNKKPQDGVFVEYNSEVSLAILLNTFI